MTLVERGFPSAEVRDLHEAGTPRAFERVARFIRARISGETRGPWLTRPAWTRSSRGRYGTTDKPPSRRARGKNLGSPGRRACEQRG